ncbi:MAG TPA: glycosyltransferase family 39 protein, partial [Pyrinomonadaceae bacterium]|nr:glycosyltransferase family 39 protein [Pyrinomonadaceae bacterium]
MEEVVKTPESEARKGLDLPWLASCAAVTVVATFLRFFWLGLKPFHHDEGVNGWFLTNLFRDGEYRYDPANYHGPTLYYISLAFSKVFGLETLTVRWSVAVWGVLTVVLAFYLRRYIGRVGSLSAAALIALSPGMVFISRYFIHEMFFVFLGLALVLAVIFFIENRPAGPGAIGWMSIVLLAAFFPTNLSSAIWLSGGETASISWLVTFFVFEAVL